MQLKLIKDLLKIIICTKIIQISVKLLFELK